MTGSHKVNRRDPLPGQSIPVRASSPTPAALWHALQALWTRPLSPQRVLLACPRARRPLTDIQHARPLVESRVMSREPPPLRIASFATPTDAPRLSRPSARPGRCHDALSGPLVVHRLRPLGVPCLFEPWAQQSPRPEAWLSIHGRTR